MSLRHKFLLLLALTAAAPALVTGLLIRRDMEEQLAQALAEQHLRTAHGEAEHVATYVRAVAERLSESLAVPNNIPSETAQAEEWLTSLYGSQERMRVVGLFDGQARMTAAVSTGSRQDAARGGRPLLEPQESEDFQRRTKALLARAHSGRAYSVSEPYMTVLQQRPAVLVAGHAPDGQGPSLVAELSLDELSHRLATTNQGESRVFLLDGAGRLMLDGSSDQDGHSAHFQATSFARQGGTFHYEEGGRPWLAAFSPVPELGWMAVAAHPQEAPFASLRGLNPATPWLLALVVTGGLGLALMTFRSMGQSLAQLANGARQLAQGNLKYRIELARKDELGDLADAFNEMGRSLENAHRELVHVNGKLLAQVEEQTRDLKQAQEQLLRSQRLVAVGDLAAGMAHEMNTPLSVITANLQLLLVEEPEGSPARPMLTAAHRQALRMAEIIRELRALEARQRGEMAPVDLHPVVERAVEARIQELDTAGVHVVCRFHAGQAMVLGDGKALDDVFHRLLGNALSAMEGRPERRITLVTHVIERQAVRVELSDTGRGIPREHLDRLFNPFFTTKQQWSDKGLSLAVCHRVIEVHGGKISIQSDEGVGTTVTIELPVAPPAQRTAV
ncbi:sensor histidine kinase [Stigmatella aurantiaca]|uniref:histidine kinase n=4 Tax=Stigmatella aurantiaca TaxID=41 RepID=E3FG36_STIAD|nr:ATP-binding protein [Stigmatella aurantiaca]ADO68971.1 Sensor protein [Stigmatella aurantiaca DW4/3-1]